MQDTVCRISLVLVLASGPLSALLGAELPRTLTNSIGMTLVLIPPGEFIMGSTESSEELDKASGYESAPHLYDGEHPAHRVRITQPFYMGVHEVTVGQFRKFADTTGYKTFVEREIKPGRGWNAKEGKFEKGTQYTWRDPGFEQTDDHPVVNLAWKDARAFCEWLSEKEHRAYRLPYEAEWEYACRAGTTTRYYNGNDPELLPQVANVADATAKGKFRDWAYTIRASDGYAFTAPVGSFRPNAFGLFDMHGNAAEWCIDRYDPSYYAICKYAPTSPAIDPKGPTSGTYCVVRGGSWRNRPWYVRSACRIGWQAAGTCDDSCGLRVICER